MPEETKRREFLQWSAALGGVASLGALSGCIGGFNPLSSGGGNPVKKLPAETDAVTVTKVKAIINDEATKSVVNAVLQTRAESEYYRGPENLEEALEQVEKEGGLDPRKVSESIGFSENTEAGQTMKPGEQFSGSIVKADYSEDELVDNMEENGPSLEEDEISGKTVYKPEDAGPGAQWMAVLSSGTYLTGNEKTVETTIEAWKGNGDRIDKELKKGFSSTQSAPIRSVYRIPSDQLPKQVSGEDSPIEVDPMENVKYGTMVVYRDGDKRGALFRFQTDSSDSATEVADVLDSLLVSRKDEVKSDPLTELISNVTIESKGSEARIRYEASIEEWTDLAETLAGPTGGGPGPGPGPGGETPTPSATFDFEYDDNTGVVRVTHNGGDTFTRENTQAVRVGVEGGSMSRWRLPISAGDTTEVRDVSGGDEVVVVWVAPDSGRATIVGSFVVPS